MTDDNKPAPVAIPFKLILIEMVGLWVAVYFILCASSPEVLTDMGLPALVHGPMAYGVGILSLITGGVPLIRFLIDKNSK